MLQLDDSFVKTPEMIAEELLWIAQFVRHIIKSPIDYECRLNGQYSAALIYYVITGELNIPTQKIYKTDISPALNIYAIAPPHVQKMIEPIVAGWKLEVWPSVDAPEETGEICQAGGDYDVEDEQMKILEQMMLGPHIWHG